MLRTRFAPSPTGFLHIGNIYSALQCEKWARAHGAELLLRIEDIDFTRCRDELSNQLLDDLYWLGFKFDGDVVFQQQRRKLYDDAIQQLSEQGLLYPCFCTRKELEGNLNFQLFDGYPGSCKALSIEEIERKKMSEPYSLRLDIAKVSALLGENQAWLDIMGVEQPFRTSSVGDVIISRKDIGCSYHLAVVVDDAVQEVSHVIRGEDLKKSTDVHHLLQKLLGLNHPLYHHHELINDYDGERMAKSKKSLAIKELREKGVTPEKIRKELMESGTVYTTDT